MIILFSKQGSNTIVFRTPILVPKFYATVNDFVESNLPLPLEMHRAIIKALQCSCVRLLPSELFDKEFEDGPVWMIEATL